MITASGLGYAGTATATSFDNGWEDKPAALIATSGSAVVGYGDKIYVLGGSATNTPVQIWNGAEWTLGAPLSGNDNIGDACLGLDAAGQPVIDLLGGPGKTGFNRYHITSDNWTMVPFPAGFPSTGLAGVDVVSMLRHTGENVCYLSGGSSGGSGGDSNALYAYYPDTGELSHLGDYTYASSGVSRHFSWYVPWVGGGAICIAGGADNSFTSHVDSQCYVLTTKVFNAPNADLGPLPQAWSAGGDAKFTRNPWIWTSFGCCLTRSAMHEPIIGNAGSPSMPFAGTIEPRRFSRVAFSLVIPCSNSQHREAT